jgi:Zn-finger nucleic acid-binding protein
MPFLDRNPVCPRCRVDLARVDEEREAWCCPLCEGCVLGVGDRELLTVSRRAAATFSCPACRSSMEPVYLASIEVERCRADNLLWLERGAREVIVARADEQLPPGPLEHLRALHLEAPARREARTWLKRVATVASLLVILAALPLGLFGVLLVAIGSASSGFDALAAPVGWLVVAIASFMFLVGGIVFVRAAR